jgi:hypothetical protein
MQISATTNFRWMMFVRYNAEVSHYDSFHNLQLAENITYKIWLNGYDL